MSNAEGAGMNMTESNSTVRKIFLSHSEQILDEMLDKANILTFIYYPKEQRYEGLKLPKGFGVAPESGERFTESFVALFKMVPMHELLFREAVKAIDDGGTAASDKTGLPQPHAQFHQVLPSRCNAAECMCVPGKGIEYLFSDYFPERNAPC